MSERTASRLIDWGLLIPCNLIWASRFVLAKLGITWGVGLAPASNAALLSLTLPIATAFIAYLLLGERMTTVRWISFALAVAGVLQCSGIDWNDLRFASGGVLGSTLLITVYEEHYAPRVRATASAARR